LAGAIFKLFAIGIYRWHWK